MYYLMLPPVLQSILLVLLFQNNSKSSNKCHLYPNHVGSWGQIEVKIFPQGSSCHQYSKQNKCHEGLKKAMPGD
jgi:hypothetical protein